MSKKKHQKKQPKKIDKVAIAAADAQAYADGGKVAVALTGSYTNAETNKWGVEAQSGSSSLSIAAG